MPFEDNVRQMLAVSSENNCPKKTLNNRETIVLKSALKKRNTLPCSLFVLRLSLAHNLFSEVILTLLQPLAHLITDELLDGDLRAQILGELF